MSKRTEVEEALYSLLIDQFPEIHWQKLVTGAARGREMMGTIACERISYEWLDKFTKAATATFSIYVMDISSTNEVDNIADDIIRVLSNDRTLSGTVVDSLVKEVIYGMAQGRPDVGAVLIHFVVTYDC